MSEPLTKHWLDYAVKLHAKTAQASAAVWLEQILDQAVAAGAESQLSGPAFTVYNTFGALVAGAPNGRFRTDGLKAFLDQCGMVGMLIDSDESHPGVVLYNQKAQQGGTRVALATAEHCSWTFANGILLPNSVDLPSGGDAVIESRLVPFQSAAVPPLAFSAAATLPVDVYPAATVKHTMGPIKLNSAMWDGMDSVRIENNFEIVVAKGGSDIYPTLVYIQRIQPTITVSGAHIDVLTTLTVDGKYYTAGQILVYARKRAEGGSFVADNTAEHVKWSLGKCRIDWQSVEGSPKKINLKISPWNTPGVSPVYPLAITTASAIA